MLQPRVDHVHSGGTVLALCRRGGRYRVPMSIHGRRRRLGRRLRAGIALRYQNKPSCLGDNAIGRRHHETSPSNSPPRQPITGTRGQSRSGQQRDNGHLQVCSQLPADVQAATYTLQTAACSSSKRPNDRSSAALPYRGSNLPAIAVRLRACGRDLLACRSLPAGCEPRPAAHRAALRAVQVGPVAPEGGCVEASAGGCRVSSQRGPRPDLVGISSRGPCVAGFSIAGQNGTRAQAER